MQKAMFVTGGTVGTGFATAEKFAQNGYAVFITSRKAERAVEAAGKITDKYGVFAKGYGLDIRNEQVVIDTTPHFIFLMHSSAHRNSR